MICGDKAMLYDLENASAAEELDSRLLVCSGVEMCASKKLDESSQVS